MEFGIFDHLDYRNEPAARTYADRLELIGVAEAAGFRAYHLAEHHGTPLGMAPSPAVFLAAAAVATRRIRLGAMVFCLPLYTPLRLLEEICMLDQLSGGRLDVGVGRGASPFETAFFGIDPREGVARYVESLDIIRAGLAGERLNFKGRFFSYENVPLPLRPVQAEIPFWSAPATPESQEHAARLNMNIMVLGADDRVRDICGQYRQIWPRFAPDPGGTGPLVGAYRIVHVAATDAQAERLARPAFDLWFRHAAKLWRENNATTGLLNIADFETASAVGMLVAGSPAKVRDVLAAQIDTCGYNYPVLEFAFGDLPHRAEMESLALFAEKVMPELA